MDNKSRFTLSDVKKDELINQLVSFALTDTLLFLPNDKTVISALQSLNDVLNTVYVLSQGIEVLPQNVQQNNRVKQYLEKLSSDDVVFVYQVGKQLRSVLLAILLRNKILNLRQVFDLAFYEELCQQKDWGKTEEIVKRQNDIWEKLTELCEQYDKRSIS